LQGRLEGDKKGKDLPICIFAVVQGNLEGEKKIYHLISSIHAAAAAGWLSVQASSSIW
jgi:hypothetical protein